MKRFLFVFFCYFAFASPRHSKEESPDVVAPQYLDKLLEEGRYEEFNLLLGIDNPRLSSPRTGNRTHHPRFNPELEHGDILLTSRQKEQARQGIDFYSDPDSKWPNGKIPYYISSKYGKRDVKLITDSFREMNAKLGGCLIMTPWNWDNDYVYIASRDGCYSSLGRTGGAQILSLDLNGCMDPITVQHEACHASGLMHEQCRFDRDEYITVHRENIQPDWWSQFEMLPSEGYTTVGPYDCMSIMHYPAVHPDFLVDGADRAFDVIDEDGIDIEKIGYSEEMTESDIYKLKNMYC